MRTTRTRKRRNLKSLKKMTAPKTKTMTIFLDEVLVKTVREIQAEKIKLEERIKELEAQLAADQNQNQ